MITFKDVQVVIATPEMKTEVYDFWKEVYVYERGYIEESSWLEYVRHDAAVNELATTFCCVYQGQIVATIRCLPLTEGGVIPTLSHFPDLDLSEYDLSKLMDVGKSMKLR